MLEGEQIIKSGARVGVVLDCMGGGGGGGGGGAGGGGGGGGGGSKTAFTLTWFTLGPKRFQTLRKAGHII